MTAPQTKLFLEQVNAIIKAGLTCKFDRLSLSFIGLFHQQLQNYGITIIT